MEIDRKLAREAKAIVAIAFRNGPIEDIHAGKTCPTCQGKRGYSRITEKEMKLIVKVAVDRVYAFLWLQHRDPKEYEVLLKVGDSDTREWDDPSLTTYL